MPRAEAEPPAAALGVAFQLTNFLRDVGEDLDRGRVYLPADELAAFGVDRELLAWCRRTRRPDPRVRRALAHLVAHTRAVYRRAAARASRCSSRCPAPAWRCAFTLYRRHPRRDRGAPTTTCCTAGSRSRPRRAAVAVPASPGPAAAHALARRATAGGRSPDAAQKAMAWARRLTSRCRPARSDAIGVPGSESSSANSQRRMSGVGVAAVAQHA